MARLVDRSIAALGEPAKASPVNAPARDWLANRKPRGHGQERREEILAAARILFARDGVEGVGVRSLADVVGVSSATIYAYFPTKEAIAVELCRRSFLTFADAASKVGANAPASPEQRLLACLRKVVAFGLSEPTAYRVAFCGLSLRGAGPWQDPSRPAHKIILDVLTPAIAQLPDLPSERRETTAQTLWLGVHGLIALGLDRPDLYEGAAVERQLLMLVEGLAIRT